MLSVAQLMPSGAACVASVFLYHSQRLCGGALEREEMEDEDGDE